MDQTNLQPPFLAPTYPVYPLRRQIVRVTGDGSGFIQQYDPIGGSFRDREPCQVWEPNGILVPGAYYRARIVATDSTPLAIISLACCVPTSASSSPSSRSSSQAPVPFSSSLSRSVSSVSAKSISPSVFSSSLKSVSPPSLVSSPSKSVSVSPLSSPSASIKASVSPVSALSPASPVPVVSLSSLSPSSLSKSSSSASPSSSSRSASISHSALTSPLPIVRKFYCLEAPAFLPQSSISASSMSAGISTNCCPGPVPSTLYATITNVQNCPNLNGFTIILTYNPVTQAWESSIGAAIQLSLLCIAPDVWYISSMTDGCVFSAIQNVFSCTPFDIPFTNIALGITPCVACGGVAGQPTTINLEVTS